MFDALARAARHQANKHSLPVKESASDKPGNAGTFLFKLEGILEGLVADMIAVGTPEATVRPPLCPFCNKTRRSMPNPLFFLFAEISFTSRITQNLRIDTVAYRKRLEKFWKFGRNQRRFPLMYYLACWSLSTMVDKVPIRFFPKKYLCPSMPQSQIHSDFVFISAFARNLFRP